jgi:hypothetical protein
VTWRPPKTVDELDVAALKALVRKLVDPYTEAMDLEALVLEAALESAKEHCKKVEESTEIAKQELERRARYLGGGCFDTASSSFNELIALARLKFLEGAYVQSQQKVAALEAAYRPHALAKDLYVVRELLSERSAEIGNLQFLLYAYEKDQTESGDASRRELQEKLKDAEAEYARFATDVTNAREELQQTEEGRKYILQIFGS